MKLSTTLVRSVGALFLLGALPSSASAALYGAWESPVDGNWNNPARWVLGDIPNGTGALADFSNTSGVTVNVTLDDTVSLEQLVNSGPGITGGLNLVGSGELILAADGADVPGFSLRNAVIGVRLSGNQGLRIWPTGSVTLSGNNSYTGQTRIYGGVVTVGNNNAFGAGGGASNKTIVGQESGEAAAVGLLNGINVANETILLGRSYNSDLGTLHVSGTNATATWSGTIEIGKSLPQIGSGTNSSNTLIVAGDIVNGNVGGISGANSLEINGLGTVLLQGKAAYTGQTTIRSGTLKLGNDERLSTQTVLAMGISGNKATFDLNGYDQTISRVILGANTNPNQANLRTITNSSVSARSVLTILGSSESVAMVYTGNLTVVKEGSGNMIVHQLSNYEGDTYVKEGRLTLQGLVLANDSDVYVEVGALLVWDSGVTGIDEIGSLFYNGSAMALGTYGSLGNMSADFQVEFIQGNALLAVTAVPEPCTLALALGGGGILLLAIRRKRARTVRA